MDQGGGSRSRIGPGALTGLCLLLAAAAYRPLLRLPTDPPLLAFERWLFEPSHVEPLLVVAGAAWLGWRRRQVLARAAEAHPGAPLLGAGLFAAAAAVHAWATLTQAGFLLAPSLMLAAAGFAALHAGLAGCRALALPIGFLIFAVPVPAPLLNLLVWEQQEAIGQLTARMLSAVGLPATAAGILFERPGRLFIVIETCSGFRFAEVFAAVGVLLRGLERPSAPRTLLMALLGLLAGLFVNQLRVLWIAVGTGPLAVGDAHDIQGIAVLAVGLPLMIGIHRLVREPSGPDSEVLPASPVLAPGPTRSLAGLLVLLAGVSFALIPEALPRAQGYDLSRIPAAKDGWESELLATDFLLFGHVRFDEVVRRGYSAPEGEIVELFIGTALRGDPRTSPFSRSTELPESGWIVLERFPAHMQGRPVEGLILAAQGVRALAYTWRVGDRGLLAETLRAGLALDRNPFAAPRRRAVVRIATNLNEPGHAERERAGAVLEGFADAFAETFPDA